MPFIVMSSTAKMPTTCKGRYRRVAVCQVADANTRPRMISPRARGMVRIVETWERLHAEGRNTAYARALTEAHKLAESLNKPASLIEEFEASFAD